MAFRRRRLGLRGLPTCLPAPLRRGEQPLACPWCVLGAASRRRDMPWTRRDSRQRFLLHCAAEAATMQLEPCTYRQSATLHTHRAHTTEAVSAPQRHPHHRGGVCTAPAVPTPPEWWLHCCSHGDTTEAAPSSPARGCCTRERCLCRIRCTPTTGVVAAPLWLCPPHRSGGCTAEAAPASPSPASDALPAAPTPPKWPVDRSCCTPTTEVASALQWLCDATEVAPSPPK